MALLEATQSLSISGPQKFKGQARMFKTRFKINSAIIEWNISVAFIVQVIHSVNMVEVGSLLFILLCCYHCTFHMRPFNGEFKASHQYINLST